MTKPEWGTKRICRSCGTRYYDLRRSPIECAKCGSIFDPEALVKMRRPRQAPAPVSAVVEESVVAAEGVDAEAEKAVEDASELGEDEDDVAEVLDNVEEKKGER